MHMLYTMCLKNICTQILEYYNIYEHIILLIFKQMQIKFIL